ncbi:MAG: peptidylprolyl isomerase, partial [Lentisphaeria bacterium]
NNGGMLGFFSRGQMVKPFEEAAFKLKNNELSEIVKTQFGYHLIKKNDFKNESIKPLSEVKNQIINRIQSEKKSQISKDLLQHSLKIYNAKLNY